MTSDPIPYQIPTHRKLNVFAFDPMLIRSPLHRITVEVPYEPLGLGPRGSRIHVLDFDGVSRRYYEPVNLDDGLVLLQDGLEPTESDPRFHQQLVYVVPMKVVENFDIALRRRFYFRGRKPLLLYPDGFYGANAFLRCRTSVLNWIGSTIYKEADVLRFLGQRDIGERNCSDSQ